MKQKSRIPTLIMIVISVGVLISMILLHRDALYIIGMSLIVAYLLCIYLCRFTPLSAKGWLKWVDKALRVALLICVLLLFVQNLLKDWPTK